MFNNLKTLYYTVSKADDTVAQYKQNIKLMSKKYLAKYKKL